MTDAGRMAPRRPDVAVTLDYAPPVAGWRGVLFRYVPALDSLRRYSWNACGADLMAGLTVTTVAVPQAMAYATLAGIPPQYGLYTAIIMTAVGALLDSSRQLINGPTNAISIALLSALAVIPEGERTGAAILLAFLVGVIQLAIALMHLGDLTRYVSHSVIVGFTAGAGTLLVLDQIKHFVGLRGMGQAEDHFLKRLWLSLSDGGPVHWPTVGIGVLTVAIVLGVRQFNTYRRLRGARFPLPQHLVAVVFIATLVWALRLDERLNVKIVGAIPPTLPGFEVPAIWDWEQLRLLSGNAFAIAILGLLEAVAMAKGIAARTGQKLDINQQCLSEGAANLAGSFFQCMPGSGSLTRSAVNQQAGAVSQWSGVFSALTVAATVLLFAPLAQYIPRASLAGLLMLAAFRMVDREQLLFHLRATRFDAGVVLATALAALVISVEFCIVIGVFLSFVLYVPRAAQARMTRIDLGMEQPVTTEPPRDRLLVYHLEGELFFGSEPEIARHLDLILETAHTEVRAVVLVLDRARNPDAAFLHLLREFHKRLESRGIALLLAAVSPEMATALAASQLTQVLGTGRIHGLSGGVENSTREAIQSAYKAMDWQGAEDQDTVSP